MRFEKHCVVAQRVCFLMRHIFTQKRIFSHYLLSLMLIQSQVKLFLELHSTAVLQLSPQQLKYILHLF